MNRVVHNAVDVSGRYRVLVEEQRHLGFPTLYKVRVVDQVERTEIADDEVYHTDADAICEGWANVSILLAAKRTVLQGAYVIGSTEY